MTSPDMLAAAFNQLHQKTIAAAKAGQSLQAIHIILAQAEREVDFLMGAPRAIDPPKASAEKGK